MIALAFADERQNESDYGGKLSRVEFETKAIE